jgi:hypothetical protein
MPSWNKNLTKETHASVAKISTTMKARKIDNFKQWREANPVQYAQLPHGNNLAEYIGAVLGDGHIEKFPRTERITITGDFQKPDYVWRYADITQKLFHKMPTIAKAKKSNGFRLSLYQKFISERLGIPTGDRTNFAYKLPKWIVENESYLLSFLRGLFEAEGSLSIHLPTCTYNFSFTNFNQNLLDIVRDSLLNLEFHPEVRHNAIRIRKKAEVEKLKSLIHFREY